ncbi:MAG TPA: hypothetical protein VNT53_02845 [Pseudolysinimonas sp.]|nr:hypothetical protein [Pseudolysinimonas sp.]
MDEAILVKVHPRRALLLTGFVSVMAVAIPVFGVLYWFGSMHGTVPYVLLANIGLVLVCGAIVLRQLTVYTAVTATELSGRGIFSPIVRVPIDRIASVHLVDTYAGLSTDPVTQLLVCDREGSRLFRMRGNYWHAADLRAVAHALPVPTTVVDQPLSMREFFASYPHSAYWFEQRPVLRLILLGILVSLTLWLSLWIMTLIGMPIGLFA